VTRVNGKRALVLEDEPAIAKVLESYLRRDGYEPTLCGTVEAGLAALRNSKPQILILDVGLPDGSGLDVLRESRAGSEHIPVIVLTARGDEADRIVGLELGADDYVTKPFSPRELMARLRAILRRTDGISAPAAAPGRMLRAGALEIDFTSHEARVDGKPANLTATEFRILGVLASSPGEVFTRATLLDRLQDAGKIYERTLDRHINNLRKKIERDRHEPSYIITVYGVGYKLRRP